ncbi:PilN domain-containing protein [Billgrantia gudaonensis]|uniref:Type IV pilus assembly protein PilN n=1 Tax=Billgrantia gudaonensis TaxID=376427 RepID=A0A1G8RKH4_9GAMM|nr:PilN domain-containing protein [Halomonas gudaonensis]SDJ17497.1 type IV pilus assembly protein PilN [Halomonas gudaonensis]
MSIEINLLPWREKQRARRSRRFYLALVLMAGLGVGGGLGVTQFYQAELSAQQQRNAHVRESIAALDQDIRSITEYEAVRERMAGQLDVFAELQQGRSQTVAVFRDLTRSLVEGVHYTSMTRQGERLRLTGLAEADRQVSDQLRALAAAPSLAEPVLSEVESANGDQRRFALSVTQQSAGATSAEDEAEGGEP